MKIIQSYFLHDFRKENGFAKSFGGWNALEFNLMGICLSALTLNENVGKTTFIGDEKIIDFLKNDAKIEMDYVVKKDVLQSHGLDEIRGLWALSKLAIYSEIKEPFLHFDCDFFAWKKLPNAIYESEVVTQEPECDETYPFAWKITYKPYVDRIESELTKLPSWWKIAPTEKEERITIYNLGVFGGKNARLINECSMETLDFIRENREILKRKSPNDLSDMMHVFEQYALSRALTRRGAKIWSLIGTAYERLFFNVRENIGFSHFVHIEKKKKEKEDELIKKLGERFPDVWKRLQEIFDKKIHLKKIME